MKPLSMGWIFLLAGVIGVMQNLRATHFSWINDDGNLSHEQRSKFQTPMTPKLRILAISICLALMAGGVWKIQHDHWWNPFLGHPTDRQLSPAERHAADGAVSTFKPNYSFPAADTILSEVLCSTSL